MSQQDWAWRNAHEADIRKGDRPTFNSAGYAFSPNARRRGFDMNTDADVRVYDYTTVVILSGQATGDRSIMQTTVSGQEKFNQVRRFYVELLRRVARMDENDDETKVWALEILLNEPDGGKEKA